MVVKSKPDAMSSIDKPILNEILVKVELVITHRVLLVLHDWHCLKLKSEWHMRETKVFCQPPVKSAIFLDKDNELIFTWSQNHVQSEFVFINQFGLNTHVIVNAFERFIFV